MKGRPSPRKAIQTWLVQNERGDGGQGAVLPDDFAETGYDTSQRRHTSTVQRSRREITSHCDEGADTLTPLRKRFGTSDKQEVRTTDEVQRDSRPAERFDLNSPFRHMETKDPEGARQLSDPAKQRKRHRSSSTSSYLEPAILDNVVDGDDEHTGRDKTSRSRRRHAVSSEHERDQEISSLESSGSSGSEVTLAQQPRSYERRPRHKTKEDRYELKHEKKRKRPEKDKKKSTRRQPRNAKTGATLLHDFTAQNVASERLTLRPTSKLGLFAKGRTSTAVTRQGLPDLAFSEMAFLKPRETRADPRRDLENMRLRKGKRAANVDDEISRFFKSADSPLLERDANVKHRRAQPSPIHHTSSSLRVHPQKSSTTSSSLPPPSPLTNPFLGFGVPGPRPDISVRIGSIERSSISPSKHQSQHRREHSGTPLSWSRSPQVPSSLSRPRNILGSMSVRSEGLEHNRTRPLRAVSERSPVRVPSIPRMQLSVLPEHHGEIRDGDSPLTLVESTQHQSNSQSQDLINHSIEQEPNQLESRPATEDRQHPAAIGTPVNSEQPQAKTENGGSNALPSDTRKDPPCQPATAHERRCTEASPVDRPRTFHEEETNRVEQPQDPAILNEFAADLNELLGKWKGRTDIPDDLSKGIQISGISGFNTENRDTRSPENQTPDHPVGTAVQDEVGDAERPQEAPASAHEPRPNTNETLSTRARVSSERDRVPSRISMSRSQKSWTDPRVLENYRNHLDARSPFHDSTYSTCGAGSIYEQQMQDLPSALRFDQRLHRHIEHPGFANTRMVNHPATGRPNNEPPYLPLQGRSTPQSASSFTNTRHHGLQEEIEYPVFNDPTPQSGMMQTDEFDRGRSVEALDHAGIWPTPTSSYLQMESQPSSAPHHNSPRHHFQTHVFGDKAMTEAELYFVLGDSEHSEGALEAGNVTEADTEEGLVGFWKPNRLY